MHNSLFTAARLLSTVCLGVLLTSCEEPRPQPVDVALLSTDVYGSVAQHTLVLPFIAMEEFASRPQSFSLDREGDHIRAREARDELLRASTDPADPREFDHLSIVVRTYGWNDFQPGQRGVCALLSRAWARSVCDNPWAATRQALPGDRFRLVDLRRLQVADGRDPVNCIDTDKPRRELPQAAGEAVMICEAKVYGGDSDEFHSAVVRIDGDLGASWLVWRHGQHGETAEAMTEREGKAIAAFVRHGLGEEEDFPALHTTMCRLRRPGSTDSPKGPDCPGAPPADVRQPTAG